MNTKKLYQEYETLIGKEITMEGWIKNHRKQKEFGFIDFMDGTNFKSVQIVYDNKLSNFEEIQKLIEELGIKSDINLCEDKTPTVGNPYTIYYMEGVRNVIIPEGNKYHFTAFTLSSCLCCPPCKYILKL